MDKLGSDQCQAELQSRIAAENGLQLEHLQVGLVKPDRIFAIRCQQPEDHTGFHRAKNEAWQFTWTQ